MIYKEKKNVYNYRFVHVYVMKFVSFFWGNALIVVFYFLTCAESYKKNINVYREFDLYIG